MPDLNSFKQAIGLTAIIALVGYLWRVFFLARKGQAAEVVAAAQSEVKKNEDANANRDLESLVKHANDREDGLKK